MDENWIKIGYCLHIAPRASINWSWAEGVKDQIKNLFLFLNAEGLWGSIPQFQFDNYCWRASPRFYRLLTGDALSLGMHQAWLQKIESSAAPTSAPGGWRWRTKARSSLHILRWFWSLQNLQHAGWKMTWNFRRKKGHRGESRPSG